MKSRNKTKLILTTLLLSLTLSGCGNLSEKDLDDAKNNIENLMEDSNFYNGSSSLGYKKDKYGNFYNKYLDNFITHMSKKQYNILKNIVTNVEELDEYEYEGLVNELNKIMCDEGDLGYGFYAAFNTELLYEEFNDSNRLNNSTYRVVNNIKTLINDDELFYDALFSRKINKIEKLIIEKTGANKEDVENLITLLDAYYLVENSEDYSLENKESIESNIDELMKNIINAKFENDQDFASTFYGRLLKSSNYFGDPFIKIYEHFINGKSTITIRGYDNSYITFDFNSDLLSQKDLELLELKRIVANDYIEEAYKRTEDQEYDAKAMQLISFLPSEKCTLENTKTAEEIRCELYKDLGDYFDSSDDFNDFLIRLFNKKESALNRYFSIFKERIEEDGIDEIDFIRYQALRSLVKKYESNTYTYNYSYSYIETKDLKELPEEYALSYVTNNKSNYQFYVDYDSFFKEMDEILSNNDLGISAFLCEDIEFKWWTKPITITSDWLIADIISLPIELKIIDYNGEKLYYYEAPRGFEEGHLVRTYYNIDGDLVIKKGNGLYAVIKNPETGEDMIVTVVGINRLPNIKEYEDLRYKTDFSLYKRNYNATTDEKKLLR